MDLSKCNGWVWMRHKLFVLSVPCFISILVFQQLFDLATTLYLTSLPNGSEANPILAPVLAAPTGWLWLIALKLLFCLLIILMVPKVAKDHPHCMWGFKLVCFMYWLLVAWNGYLVVSTML